MKITLPYLMRVPAYRYRNGVRHHAGWRYYVRRGGKHIRIRGEPGEPAFMAAYHAALGRKPESTAKPKTWRWLCEAYMRSPEWAGLADATRTQRRRVMQHTWTEPLHPGSSLLIGDCPIEAFSTKHVRALRDRKRDHPEAANHRLKVISAVFRWAIEAEHAERNPARDVQPLRPLNRDGHHTWTVDEVRQYERRHPIGTKARLALALFLFTGARISDVARLGRPNAQDGWLRWTVKKGGQPIEVPILPELQAIIDATPLTGMQTWLVTQHGKPHTAKGLGNWFRRRCDEAGLHHCSAHGLRKAGATIAAEHGATVHQLMAIYGWQTAKQAIEYTRAAAAGGSEARWRGDGARGAAEGERVMEITTAIRIGRLADGRVYLMLGASSDDVMVLLDDIKRCCGSLARESLDRWAESALSMPPPPEAPPAEETPIERLAVSDPLGEIAAERRRQIEVEGWTAEHDDTHRRGELALAGACYAERAGLRMRVGTLDEEVPPPHWPFERDWWKPKKPRRDLVRAAALILAEIERLDREALRLEGAGVKVPRKENG